MLRETDVDTMVVRQGVRFDGPVPVDLASARALSEKGYTILLRHAERHHRSIAELADCFSETFQSPANVHIYATPPGNFGFSWHYDAEDVFIMQTSGEKEYELRKNTVNPWPLAETIPQDMKYERELMPLMRIRLQAGDLLYIPCGYWHRAKTSLTTDTAISLALGILSRTAMDLFDLLRSERIKSPVWRQRLPFRCIQQPPVNAGIDLGEEYEYLLEQLASDLARTVKSDEYRRLVCNRQGVIVPRI